MRFIYNLNLTTLNRFTAANNDHNETSEEEDGENVIIHHVKSELRAKTSIYGYFISFSFLPTLDR